MESTGNRYVFNLDNLKQNFGKNFRPLVKLLEKMSLIFIVFSAIKENSFDYIRMDSCISFF